MESLIDILKGCKIVDKVNLLLYFENCPRIYLQTDLSSLRAYKKEKKKKEFRRAQSARNGLLGLTGERKCI